jgi:hypothetical protein
LHHQAAGVIPTTAYLQVPLAYTESFNGNQTGSINAFPCAEVRFASSLSSQAYLNLLVTSRTNGCSSSQPIFAFAVTSPDSTDQVFNNFLYSTAGNNTAGSGNGFSFGPSNLTGISPNFANPVEPGAPSCGSFASVPACMATLIANFTPQNTAAKAYGFQMPSPVQTYDPLFPQWLCNVNLPSGLITMGCFAQSSLPPSPTIVSVDVQ